MSERIQLEPGMEVPTVPPRITLRELAELSGQEQQQMRRYTHTVLIREASRKRQLAVRQCMERAKYDRDYPDKYL